MHPFDFLFDLVEKIAPPPWPQSRPICSNDKAYYNLQSFNLISPLHTVKTDLSEKKFTKESRALPEQRMVFVFVQAYLFLLSLSLSLALGIEQKKMVKNI